ncbi:MAG: DUF4157 domain-containing protein [bacterium]
MKQLETERGQVQKSEAHDAEPAALERPSFSPAMQSAELTGTPVVQASAADGQSAAMQSERAAEVVQLAQAGVSGAGGALPHQEAIQKSFGSHDVSGINAHVGGAAAKASEGIGAEAYATGNDVAFKSDPDLHTAAHEAAHIVQQKSGVQLKGGVGEAGDAYEQHADAVADRVVQGKSAQDLLDAVPGGKGGGAGIQRAGEEQGAWLQQQQLTKDSFFDLIRQNLLAAEAWKTRAEVEDPPPFWQEALLAVGGLVLNAALGGVGGTLASRLTKGVTSFVADAAIRAAVKVGESAASKGVNAAISAASASGDKKPLVAFCEQQRMGMSAASKEARESFVKQAGTFTDQKLTIAQMAEIKAANDAAFERAQEIQNHEMLVGWMGMNAGDTTKSENTDSNVQDIDNNGILRLTIAGSGDKPTKITAATADGLNEGLRGDIAGTKVKEWRAGAKGANGQVRKTGIDFLITTGVPGSGHSLFKLSTSTWSRLAAAGKAPSSTYVSGAEKSVFFSAFVERTGKWSWKDTDMDWSIDWNFGADAGRWFLSNVHSAFDILAMLDNLTLPAVSG